MAGGMEPPPRPRPPSWHLYTAGGTCSGSFSPHNPASPLQPSLASAPAPPPHQTWTLTQGWGSPCLDPPLHCRTHWRGQGGGLYSPFTLLWLRDWVWHGTIVQLGFWGGSQSVGGKSHQHRGPPHAMQTPGVGARAGTLFPPPICLLLRQPWQPALEA